MFHPTENEIIEYAINGSSRSLKKHILSCGPCRRLFDAVITASKNDIKRITLSDLPLRRIINTYNAIEKEQETFRGKIRPFYRYFPYAAAAVIITVISIAIYSITNDSAKIIAQDVKGSATANSKAIVAGKSIKSGLNLVTGNESQLALQGNAMHLRAGSDTSLMIRRATIDKKTGKTVFDFYVTRGKVSASFDQDNILKTILRTPHAKIISHEGSRFVLSVNHDKTQLIVKQGNASLLPIDSTDEFKLEEGYSYTVQGKDSTSSSPQVEQKEVSYTDTDNDDPDSPDTVFEN